MCAKCGCEVPKETRQGSKDRDSETGGAFTFEQPAPTNEQSVEQTG
jgi:hypothetical protein